MRRTTEIFICDICGIETEVTKEFETHRIMCPARLYFKDGSQKKSEAPADMCPDCYNAYFALFDQHFATIKINLYGDVVVTKKFKTGDPFTINESEEFKNAPNT